MKNKRLILHVGFPKTGTTAIQDYLVMHRDELAQSGTSFPYDLSRHPRSFGGGAVGAPQMDGANYFFSQGRPSPQTSIDWAIEVEKLCSPLGPDQLIISHERLSYAAKDIRSEVFAALPSNVEVVFLAYLRHPLPFLNSLYLQFIMGMRLDYDAVRRNLNRPVRRYIESGYLGLLEPLRPYGRVVIRCYEEVASRGLVEDFCRVCNIPYINRSTLGSQSNVKTYGRDVGLTFLALRATADRGKYEGFDEIRDRLVTSLAEVDSSSKEFLTDKVYQAVNNRWVDESHNIKAEAKMEFPKTSASAPAPDLLAVDSRWAKRVMDDFSDRLSPGHRPWLKNALDVAVGGVRLFGGEADGGIGMPTFILRSPEKSNVKTTKVSKMAAEQGKKLNQRVVSRVARVLWIQGQKNGNNSFTAEGLGERWKAEEDKPMEEARTLLRMMQRAGLEINIVQDSE